MDFYSPIFGIIKWTLLGSLLVIGYVVFNTIIKPYLAWRKFKKYPNVRVSDKFVPFLGDFADFKKNEDKGIASYYHFIDFSLKNQDKKDFYFITSAPLTLLYVTSQRAITQFKDMVPKYFDRCSYNGRSFEKLCPSSLAFIKSTKDWKKRRESITKYMGLSQTSQYIPVMLEQCDKVLKNVKIGEKSELNILFNEITFRIITAILFGKSINEEIGEIDFVVPGAPTQKLKFSDFFMRLSQDLIHHDFEPSGLCFPFLNDYHLIAPFSTDHQNLLTMEREMKKYLENSKDENSIYHKLLVDEGLDKEKIYQDLIAFLFAGHETSSHGVTSGLYLLQKYPDFKAKLFEEVGYLRGKSLEDMQTELTKDKVSDLSYLHLVYKEALRTDSPTHISLRYFAKQDCTLCGVDIPKGMELEILLAGRHFDSNEWKDPLKFNPERFNPESEFFLTPETKQKRHPTSYLPFSQGLRNCPGQILATLEVKLILTYFLSQIDYEIDEKLLSDNYAYFGIFSQLKCDFTAIKTYMESK